MSDSMLQVQLVVPALKTDAAITATMKSAEELTLELRSDIKLPETTSIQGVIFKYGTLILQIHNTPLCREEVYLYVVCLFDYYAMDIRFKVECTNNTTYFPFR